MPKLSQNRLLSLFILPILLAQKEKKKTGTKNLTGDSARQAFSGCLAAAASFSATAAAANDKKQDDDPTAIVVTEKVHKNTSLTMYLFKRSLNVIYTM